MSSNQPTETDPHAGQPILAGGTSPEEARAAILLLHGRGASPEDILPLGEALAGEAADEERIALRAPRAAGGAWYPESFMAPTHRNEPWLSSALEFVDRAVDELSEAGVPRERTVLAGFSQGACLAAEYVARNPAPYGALLAFTGGLIGPPLTDFPHAGDLEGMRVYLSAGDTDPHVPWRRMEATREVFERMQARVTLRRWPGRPHTILPEEVEEARAILSRLWTF